MGWRNRAEILESETVRGMRLPPADEALTNSAHFIRNIRGRRGHRRLTGQSLLRAERNSNECNWSTARKKIGPVNRPRERPIDVISIASVTARLVDERTRSTPRQRFFFTADLVNWAVHAVLPWLAPGCH